VELYLICEDSLEGIFTGIYEAYAGRRPHREVHLLVGEEENLRLFAEYSEIPADSGKAVKVARTINREFGTEGYMAVCRALASTDTEKGEAIYKMTVAGLAMKNPRDIMGHLSDPYVMKVFELARFCANEAHFWVEFLRFQELESGILYARTGPKNNLLTFIMPHFANRLPLENFVIHDEIRGIYGIHPARKDWYVVTEGAGDVPPEPVFSEQEKKYGDLFRDFFHTIAINERKNLTLQRNMLPVRYREYMTEFPNIR
jgi:probable DNA metabolism protein